MDQMVLLELGEFLKIISPVPNPYSNSGQSQVTILDRHHRLKISKTFLCHP